MRVVLLLSLVAGAGCAGGTPGPLVWREDVPAAIREAVSVNRPLLVISIVGDFRKRC